MDSSAISGNKKQGTWSPLDVFLNVDATSWEITGGQKSTSGRGRDETRITSKYGPELKPGARRD